MDRRKRWKKLLTIHDVGDKEIRLEGRRVVWFSVHLRHFDGECWHSVWRMDTAHGRLHVHRPDGRIRHLEKTASNDYANWFTRAESIVERDLPSLLASWRRTHA